MPHGKRSVTSGNRRERSSRAGNRVFDGRPAD
jgi:hypothetical protein